MYLLVSIIEQTHHLPGILEGFAGIGIQGSTVIETTGMGRVLMRTHAASPEMKQINKVLKDLESSNKTLFTVIKEKDQVDKAIEVIKSFSGDLSEPGKGILFTIPLDFVEGLTEPE